MLWTAQFDFLFSAALAADESFDTELHDFELVVGGLARRAVCYGNVVLQNVLSTCQILHTR